MPRPKFSVIAGPALVVAALLWANWPALREMAARWAEDPRYSHGYLVPAFAAYLLWSRRALLADQPIAPSLWGLALIALGVALGMVGSRFYLGWFDGLSLLPALAGLALLAGGRAALRWAAPSIAFLIFMVPLPYRIETALGSPLQSAATIVSTFLLQTCGLPAIAQGNIILIDEARIGVVEACNGLGMLLMFFAFAAAFVMATPMTWGERAVIIASAAPIAFLANVARISLTGFLHCTVGGPTADTFYHDLAGWLMMPLALSAFGAELWVLARLFIEDGDDPSPAVLIPGLSPRVARPAIVPEAPR